MNNFPILLIIISLSGCAGTSIVVGTVRTPISPEMVKIYLDPPAKYEKIAIIEATSKGSAFSSAQGKMDIMVWRLKEQAAKVGANGILLESTGSQQLNGMLLVPSGNTMLGMPIQSGRKIGAGLAIYVIEE